MSILQKFLAQFPGRPEARPAMKGSATARSAAVVASFLSIVFVWTLALSVSPRLHEQIHSDATRAEHSCAVTFVSAGSYDHVVPQPSVGLPTAPIRLAIVSMLSPQWVPSPFLGAHVFEHAPPSVS
jgi:hypothetical protein